MAVSKPYDSDIPEGSPSAETREFHATDIDLRKAGFQIHMRPKQGQPLWVRRGKVYTQRQAVKQMSKGPVIGLL